MEIFEVTKKFPIEERYSLIDQIREVRDLFAFVWLKDTGKEDM